MNNRLIAHLKSDASAVKEFKYQYEVGKPVIERLASLCKEYIETSRVLITDRKTLESVNLHDTVGYELGYQAALYSILKLLED